MVAVQGLEVEVVNLVLYHSQEEDSDLQVEAVRGQEVVVAQEEDLALDHGLEEDPDLEVLEGQETDRAVVLQEVDQEAEEVQGQVQDQVLQMIWD